MKYSALKKDLNETKDVIMMYESLLDKLTEQNLKLKEWIKAKKTHEKEKSYRNAIDKIDLKDGEYECPTPSVQMPKSLRSTQKNKTIRYNFANSLKGINTGDADELVNPRVLDQPQAVRRQQEPATLQQTRANFFSSANSGLPANNNG